MSADRQGLSKKTRCLSRLLVAGVATGIVVSIWLYTPVFIVWYYFGA